MFWLTNDYSESEGVDGIRIITNSCERVKRSDQVVVLDIGKRVTQEMIVKACTEGQGLEEIFASQEVIDFLR